MSRVLVISETLEEAERIHHMLSQSVFKDISFRYPESLAHEPPETSDLYKDCSNVIKEENITAVLSFLPRHVLVHAALIRDFPHLIGPSFESVFLAVHRYYCKELICNGFNVMYSVVDMEELTNNPAGLATVFEETGTPAWVRDTYRLDGCLVRKLRGFSQFSRDLEEMIPLLKIKLDSLKPLLVDNLDRVKYPQAFEPSITLEQYLFFGKQAFSFHYVEGCIVDKTVVPWAISDVFFLRQKPKRIQYTCLPSRLTESTQYQVWGVFREIAQRLATYGFNNQFLHCEVLVTKNEIVKVVDVVPGINSEVSPLYREVLQGGDNIKAQIEVGMGLMQRTPRALPQRSSMLSSVHITKAGTRLGDVMDVKAAKANPSVTAHITNEEHVITSSTDDGQRVFDVITHDTTMETCLKASREVSNGILKLSAYSDRSEKSRRGSKKMSISVDSL